MEFETPAKSAVSKMSKHRKDVLLMELKDIVHGKRKVNDEAFMKWFERDNPCLWRRMCQVYAVSMAMELLGMRLEVLKKALNLYVLEN